VDDSAASSGINTDSTPAGPDFGGER
jgi:hypothetical protein